MDIQTILTIVTTVASFLLVTLIPSIIALVKQWKDAKAAKTDAEKQAIYNDMLNQLTNLVANAESTFSPLDSSLKAQGKKGCGAVKKQTVLNSLQVYALTQGLEFDADYWAQKVDELVDVTKKVNAREA